MYCLQPSTSQFASNSVPQGSIQKNKLGVFVHINLIY